MNHSPSSPCQALSHNKTLTIFSSHNSASWHTTRTRMRSTSSITHPTLLIPLCFLFNSIIHLSSQRTCPNCGPMVVPYPLSTASDCGDTKYHLRCNTSEHKLYFDALNGSSYHVLSIHPTTNRMVVQPSSWVPGTCMTQDLFMSQGLWLNQTLPFNVTSSNTIFLFNCSPRLLLSPLNCTTTSLCHRYLDGSGLVDPMRARQCSNDITPCCTFVAGGSPSAYKIRLHESGCQAFRSILHLNPTRPVSEWEEGLEIQWTPPSEPTCRNQSDCSKVSTCTPIKLGLSSCQCNQGYHWDHALGACIQHKSTKYHSFSLKLAGALALFTVIMVVFAVLFRKRSSESCHQSKVVRQREEMLKATTGGKPAKLYTLKEVKAATSSFSKDRLLGAGAFGEVYKGVLKDGTLVAVKSAKVGNIKSNDQVLNEVAILTQVNHKNLVRLLGCCIEANQPLMIYEYIPSGTLFDHLQGNRGGFLNWVTRLNIASQTADALAYLHSSAQIPIYHRDVKSTNILLDAEMNAKVADFGLSRLAQAGLSHISTCVQGTLGYLDPEYYRNFQLTDKSDVYSFGVVLLELLTSQKAIDFNRAEDDVNLAMYVIQMIMNKGLGAMEVIDTRLLAEEPLEKMIKSVEMALNLSLSCLREKKGERPSMKEIVQQLDNVKKTILEQ